jgi:hypothetical protein
MFSFFLFLLEWRGRREVVDVGLFVLFCFRSAHAFGYAFDTRNIIGGLVDFDIVSGDLL